MTAFVNDSSSPSATLGAATENNFQPFFVLHKASLQKSDKRSNGMGKTRRRIDLSRASPKKFVKPEAESSKDGDHDYYVNLRLQAFDFVWSKIQFTIKDVLRDINTNVFHEIQNWIFQSFETIRSTGIPSFLEATRSFPMVTDTSSKQLFAGLVLTRNMEFVDDQLTFELLGKHLKSQGCHVANLSSLDFSTKFGVGGCLRSLLQQFLKATVDAAELSILASWYKEEENYNKPVVVVIQDIERCCGSALSDFILMLSLRPVPLKALAEQDLFVLFSLNEWVVKIPVILVMGFATTINALRNILGSSALQQLCFSKFSLGTPAERMDALVKAVFLKPPSGFSVGHKVALFMRNYFLIQDGTLTSFIRALKIACTQHFFIEPLSFLLREFLPEEVNKMEEHGFSIEMMLKHGFDFQSCQRYTLTEQTSENLAHGLLEFKRLQNQWKVVVLCLYEAAKDDGIQLLDLFCEALCQKSYGTVASDTSTNRNQDSMVYPSTDSHYCRTHKGGAINMAMHYLRYLPIGHLVELVKRWEILAADISEISAKMKKLQSLLKFEEGKASKQELTDRSKIHAPRGQLKTEKHLKSLNEKAAMLIERIVRDYMQPPECISFHEIACFKDAIGLQLALIGDPRRRIQIDLLESQKLLKCSCCSRSGSSLLPAMHDTSIMYNLAQEHGDQINLHDFYQSFKSVVLSPRIRKHKARQSPLKRKRKDTEESESQACIQARFCRGITELQIAGLLRLPSKRRPDFVQRVAFGL